MNNRAAMFVEAARGPILLITLGALFALQQAGVIGFGKTWPALIIVLGLWKLFERLVIGPQAKPAGTPPYAPPFGTPHGWRGAYPNAGGFGNPGTYRSSGTYAGSPPASSPAGAAPPATPVNDPGQEGPHS